MPVIFRQLQSFRADVLFSCNQEGTWSFAQYLDEKNADFFRPFVLEHRVLRFEYDALCTKLARDILREGLDSPKLRPALETALMMAELLERIWPPQAKYMRAEQRVYRSALSLPPPFYDIAEKTAGVGIIGEAINKVNFQANFSRLLVARSRRLLVTSALIAEEYTWYRNFVARLDAHLLPIISYLAWIFFIPRLMVNIILLCQQLIPSPSMSEPLRSLGVWTRFRAQIQQSWFELTNDSISMAVGLINCFVLTGALATVAIYVGIGMQLFEVFLALLRLHLETFRLKNRAAEYRNMINIPEDFQKEINDHATHLELLIKHEQKQLRWQVINLSIVLVALCLALPMVAVSPLIPLAGALLAVITSGIHYTMIKRLEKERPTRRATELLSHGLFAVGSKPKEEVKPACALESVRRDPETGVSMVC